MAVTTGLATTKVARSSHAANANRRVLAKRMVASGGRSKVDEDKEVTG